MSVFPTSKHLCSWAGLTPQNNESAGKKKTTRISREGAYLDDIFICPHHPDKGFPGERPEYKIDCDCRKPKPGLLFRAAEKYNIDLAKSWMLGDSQSDIDAGAAAGCSTMLLKEAISLPDAVKSIEF